MRAALAVTDPFVRLAHIVAVPTAIHLSGQLAKAVGGMIAVMCHRLEPCPARSESDERTRGEEFGWVFGTVFGFVAAVVILIA